MSLQSKQTAETTTDTSGDSSRDLTTELKIICTLWLLGAILAGVGFVAFSGVFAGLV